MTTIRESVAAPVLENPNERWLPLSMRSSRDPNALREPDLHRMRATSSYLFRFNPLGFRGAKLMRDYITGPGAYIEANDASVAQVLRSFWRNPYCNMDRIIRRATIDAILYGRVALTVASSDLSGDTRIGYVNPFLINKVMPDHRNIILAEQVFIDNKPFTVVHIDEDPNSPTYGKRIGECFYFAVNCVGDDIEGMSDLFPVADFADCLDQLIFSSLERMSEEMKWVWDIQMTGASEQQVREMADGLNRNPPKPGSFNVHNEFIKWSPLASGIQASNVNDEANMIRDYALGGMGVPTHFFSEPNAGGRQLAEAMASPAYQTLGARQAEIELLVTEIGEYVLDHKIIAGQLPADVDRTFTISFPKISMRDLQRIGGAMLRVAQALAIASENRWIDETIGKRIFMAMLAQLDLGVSLENK